MTTTKLKTLVKAAADITNLYLEQYGRNPTDPEFKIFLFYDSTEKGSELVNIHFSNCSLNHAFLEPVAIKLSKTQIQWDIIRNENEFEISIYF